MTFLRPTRFALRSSIRTQLVILVLVVITFFLAATAANLQRQEGFYRRAALEQTLTASRVVSSRVDDHFSNMDALLRTVAVAVGPQLDAIEANDGRLRQIQRGLPPYYSSISVLAPDGRMLSSSTASLAERALLNFADRKYFIDAVAKHDFAIGDPIVSRTSGEWIVIAARPILAPDRQLLAVVSMSTRLARFQELLIPQGLPPGSLMTVLNEKGIVVARSIDARQWIGRDLSASTNFQRALHEREFASDVVASDGVRRLSGYSTAQLVPWVAYVGIARDVALAPARLELRDQLLISVAALALALALMLWLIRRIAAPVRSIAATAAQIAAGHAQVRAEPGGPREIATVAEQINAMLDAQQAAQHELHAQHRALQQVLETVPVGVVRAGGDGHFVLANAAAERILGLTRSTVTGSTYDAPDWHISAIDGGPFPRRDLPVARVLRSGQAVFNVEHAIEHPDGSRVLLSVNAAPLRSSGSANPDVIAVFDDITERKRMEMLLGAERAVLEMIAAGATLAAVLDAIARNVEARPSEALCSILLLDADGVHVRHGAAPSLPDDFNRAIDGLTIGPSAGSCGTALYRNEQVVVADIETDPLWADYRALALQHGLRACWSTPVRSGEGKILGSFALYYHTPRAPGTTDLTLIEHWTHLTSIAIERSVSEEALRASEQRFRLAASGGHVWSWSVLTGVTDVSPDFWHRLGWDVPQAANSTALLESLVHPHDVGRWRQALRDHISRRVPYQVEFRARTKTGQYLWFSTRGQAIWDNNDRATQMAGTTFDITERKLAEEEIRTLNRELEQRVRQRTAQLEAANRELESFSYSASHDLRAPLRAIQGFSQIIARRHKDTLNDEARHYFDNIVVASDRMERLIDDLLRYSRLGRDGVVLQPLALTPVLADVTRLLGERLTQAGATLSVAADLPEVMGDAGLLRQIFTNLLDNALSYRRRDEALRVAIEWRREDASCVVRVADNGIGIAPEHSQRIFQMFERLHSNEDYPGTGIGLALVRKAAELMGGQVWVEADGGPGAAFCVKLVMKELPDGRA